MSLGDRRARRTLAGAAAMALAALGLTACAGGASVTTSGFAVTPTTTPGVTLSTEQSPVGRVLATGTGHTLYDFTPDTPGSSACKTGLCTQLWPPLLVTGAPTVAKGVDQALVGTIRRSNGTEQVTYGGHPLYTWIGDNRPGMVTGQALLNVGGYWYVLSPSGQQITTAFSVEKSALRR